MSYTDVSVCLSDCWYRKGFLAVKEGDFIMKMRVEATSDVT